MQNNGSVRDTHKDGNPLDIYEFLESRQYLDIDEVMGKPEDEKSMLTFTRNLYLWLSRDDDLINWAKEKGFIDGPDHQFKEDYE